MNPRISFGLIALSLLALLLSACTSTGDTLSLALPTQSAEGETTIETEVETVPGQATPTPTIVASCDPIEGATGDPLNEEWMENTRNPVLVGTCLYGLFEPAREGCTAYDSQRTERWVFQPDVSIYNNRCIYAPENAVQEAAVSSTATSTPVPAGATATSTPVLTSTTAAPAATATNTPAATATSTVAPTATSTPVPPAVVAPKVVIDKDSLPGVGDAIFDPYDQDQVPTFALSPDQSLIVSMDPGPALFGTGDNFGPLVSAGGNGGLLVISNVGDTKTYIVVQTGFGDRWNTHVERVQGTGSGVYATAATWTESGVKNPKSAKTVIAAYKISGGVATDDSESLKQVIAGF
jgi:hypothetical protein